MKAKELAELLLKTPDADIFIENLITQDFGESFHETESVIGIKQTPSGIFLSTETLDYYPTAPSDYPKMGSIRIKLLDGTWFKFGDKSGTVDELREFNECWYISTYIAWQYGTYILYSDLIQSEHIKEKIEKTTSIAYHVRDVDFVEILTEINPESWEVVWQKFKFDEALEFVKHIGK